MPLQRHSRRELLCAQLPLRIDSLYRLMAALQVELLLQPREASVNSTEDDW